MSDGMNFAVEMSQMMDEYKLEVMRAAKEAAKEAADVTAKELKKTSPRKKKKGGKYARGWRVKKQELGTLTSYVVYNGTYPSLTHLLERGHVVSNQYGSWGRLRAQPHIAPAAEAGIQRFELGIRARLRG